MSCNICYLEKPAFFCKCRNVYICKKDWGTHCDIEGYNHKDYEKVEMMNEDEKNLINSKIDEILPRLKNLRDQIYSQTSKIMIILDSASSEQIIKINELISEYERIRSTEVFHKNDSKESEIELSRSILTTEIIMEDINLSDLSDQIPSRFSSLLSKKKLSTTEILERKNEHFCLSHLGGLRCIAISDDGKIIMTGAGDSTVRFWDVEEKSQIACFNKHKSIVRALAVNSQNYLAVSGSDDRTAILWDFQLKQVKNVYRGHNQAVFTVAFNDECSVVACGTEGREIVLWSTNPKDYLKKITINTTFSVFSGVFLNDHLFLAAVGSTIDFWNIKTEKREYNIIAHESTINSINLTHNKSFIITCSNDRLIKVWDKNTRKLSFELKGHKKEILAISVTQNDKYIISSSSDKIIIIWDLALKHIVHQREWPKEFITGIVIFNSSAFTAVHDSKVREFLINSHDLVKKSFKISKFNQGSEDRKRDFVSYGRSNHVILRYFQEQGNKVVLKDGHPSKVTGTSVSEKKKIIVSSSLGIDKNLVLWNFERKQIISYLNGHKANVICVQISEDGSKVISGDESGVVLLWNAIDYNLILDLKKHDDSVISVKFTDDMKYVASVGKDSKLFIFNIVELRLHHCFDVHVEATFRLLTTGDSNFFITADFSNGIDVWCIEGKKKENHFNDFNQSKVWLEKYPDLEIAFKKYLV